MVPLMDAYEVDQVLRYPLGRSRRLALRGKLAIPHVLLPDGEVRFEQADVARFIAGSKVDLNLPAPEMCRELVG